LDEKQSSGLDQRTARFRLSLCQNSGSWQGLTSIVEVTMQRFVPGHDRTQASLLPASLEDYIDADNPVRVIEAFVEALDLVALGFAVIPASTGRPSYHPAMLLKLYIYGYCAP
jgi:hypothetical protein